MTAPARNKGGRPELPPEQRTRPVSIRLTPAQEAKVRHRPTLERLRAWLDRQPTPPDDPSSLTG